MSDLSLHRTPPAVPQPLPPTDGLLRGVLARHLAHLLVLVVYYCTISRYQRPYGFDRERLC